MRVLPEVAEVRVEVPRGGFVKRRPDGTVDFVSPLPCPFAYGSIEGTVAPDGDPYDAVVLGLRPRRGERVWVPVRAVVAFVDGGTPDPKIVCCPNVPTGTQRLGIERFFRFYGLLKGAVNRRRGIRGETAFEGWKAPF